MPFEHKLCIFAGGIKSLLLNTARTTRYLIIVMAVLGGERVFSEYIFKCPCEEHNAFKSGLTFLIAPSCVLFCVGLGLNRKLPIVLNKRSCSCQEAFKLMLSAVVPPALSLFLSMLDGDYIACALSGHPCDIDHAEYQRLVALSQFIAWGSAISVSLIVLFGFVLFWSCEREHYLVKRQKSIKEQLVEENIEKLLTENARIEAETAAVDALRSVSINVPDLTEALKGHAEEKDGHGAYETCIHRILESSSDSDGSFVNHLCDAAEGQVRRHHNPHGRESHRGHNHHGKKQGKKSNVPQTTRVEIEEKKGANGSLENVEKGKKSNVTHITKVEIEEKKGANGRLKPYKKDSGGRGSSDGSEDREMQIYGEGTENERLLKKKGGRLTQSC